MQFVKLHVTKSLLQGKDDSLGERGGRLEVGEGVSHLGLNSSCPQTNTANKQ